MLFNLIIFFFCAVVIGGFLFTRQRIIETENLWKAIAAQTNKNWLNFHQAELVKWTENTKILINNAYKERDRAWEQKFSGTKPKPQSN